MKRVIFIFIVFTITDFVCVGQSFEINLQKYWKYRQRLIDNFVVVSKDVEEPGVNIPAVDLYLKYEDGNIKKNILDWSDGNPNMSHYLGFLATEYRLLKNKGDNYNYRESLKMLYYAILAMERLDLYSESWIWKLFNIPRDPIASTDINGWMIRDDVNNDFWGKYYQHFGFNININTNFSSIFKGSGGYFRESYSQDNYYHLLEGLALIKKLVDTEYIGDIPCNFITQNIPIYLHQQGILDNNDNCNFKLWAEDFTKRIEHSLQHVSPIYMIHNDNDDFSYYPAKGALISMQLFLNPFAPLDNLKSKWYVLNPATQQLAEQGSGNV